MSTAAATAAPPPPPPPIRPLTQSGRISAEGHRHLPPAWLTLESVEEIDRFYATPTPFLLGAFAQGLLAPLQILHLVDDRCTVYSTAILLMITPNFADVRELHREPLSPALPQVEAAGWGVAHSPHLQWHVTLHGKPVAKLTGFRSQNAAWTAAMSEIQNSRNLAATSLNPHSAEYRGDKIQK
jgi:hypothetical protein